MFTQDALPILSLLFLPARRRAEGTLLRPTTESALGAWDAQGWSRADRARYVALLREEGLELPIAVRTDALARDLELLAALDRRHAVTVRMLLAATDERIARRLEGTAPPASRAEHASRRPQAPHAPRIADRLAAAAALAAEGLDVRLVLSPLRPGINDGVAALRRFVEAARSAGVTDVELGPAQHRGFFGRWIEKPAAPHVRALFERLRLEYGFPRTCAGRG